MACKCDEKFLKARDAIVHDMARHVFERGNFDSEQFCRSQAIWNKLDPRAIKLTRDLLALGPQ